MKTLADPWAGPQTPTLNKVQEGPNHETRPILTKNSKKPNKKKRSWRRKEEERTQKGISIRREEEGKKMLTWSPIKKLWNRRRIQETSLSPGRPPKLPISTRSVSIRRTRALKKYTFTHKNTIFGLTTSGKRSRHLGLCDRAAKGMRFRGFWVPSRPPPPLRLQLTVSHFCLNPIRSPPLAIAATNLLLLVLPRYRRPFDPFGGDAFPLLRSPKWKH